MRCLAVGHNFLYARRRRRAEGQSGWHTRTGANPERGESARLPRASQPAAPAARRPWTVSRVITIAGRGSVGLCECVPCGARVLCVPCGAVFPSRRVDLRADRSAP